MKYVVYLVLISLSITSSYGQKNSNKNLPSIIIRKKTIKVPFAEALDLPKTATSCDCPVTNNRSVLVKLGCQHPDTIAVCKVVITQFDVAIIPERGEVLVLKEVEGSFLDGLALRSIKNAYGDDIFVSYSNIKGMTEEGTKVVVPSFGTDNPHERATRDYTTIYNYMPLFANTKVEAFDLTAYNSDDQMVFRQTYTKDSFDKNAIRFDAVRYVFEDIKARHSSGFEVEVDDFEVANIDLSFSHLLSSND